MNMFPRIFLQPGIWMALPTGLLALLLHCQARQQAAPAPSTAVATVAFPYDLSTPSHTIFLPDEALREISGLSPTNEPGIFCAIADERGEVFFIDGRRGGAVKKKILFRDKGDFEGLEWHDGRIYAVKSDGEIFKIDYSKGGVPDVKKYETGLTHHDIEGLCYDPGRDALLLVCKEDPDRDTLRCVMAFDLKTQQLLPNAVYTVKPAEITRLSPNGPDDKDNFFSPSGIAIHPKTNDVYIVSSAKKRLVVLNYQTGELKNVGVLDKKVLPQPEGIAFDLQGNLYLSSEGKKHEALLLRFDAR
jgi:uncharacterized protein YjiK